MDTKFDLLFWFKKFSFIIIFSRCFKCILNIFENQQKIKKIHYSQSQKACGCSCGIWPFFLLCATKFCASWTVSKNSQEDLSKIFIPPPDLAGPRRTHPTIPASNHPLPKKSLESTIQPQKKPQ